MNRNPCNQRTTPDKQKPLGSAVKALNKFNLVAWRGAVAVMIHAM